MKWNRFTFYIMFSDIKGLYYRFGCDMNKDVESQMDVSALIFD